MTSKLIIKCVRGAYLEEPFERTVETSEAMTLGELHEEIQRLTGFDNDHLFTFFVARGHRGRRTEVVGSDDWEDRHDGLYGIPLKEMFPLPKNMKLFYWFDFGDDWMFQITRRGDPKPEEKGATYPRVIKEVGPKPEQYPRFRE